MMPPVESCAREFKDEDWDVSALQAAQSGSNKANTCEAVVSMLCALPKLAGGTADFKMAYDCGEGIWRNSRATGGLMESPFPGAKNMGDIWEDAYKKFEHKNCMGTRSILSMTKDGKFEKYELSPYSWISYRQAHRRSQNFGRGLNALGLKQGDIVNFFADTKEAWQISALGCYSFGFPVATTYTNLGADALQYGINLTESKVVYTDADLVPVLSKILINCPSVKHVVFNSDPRPANHPAHESDESLATLITDSCGAQAHSFEDVLRLGEGNAGLERPKVDSKETGVIMFTSGSTGNPKGVVISHQAMVAGVAGCSDAITGMCENDTYIAYLPLAHILEVCAELSCLSRGVSIGYGSPKTLTENSPCVKKGSTGDANELRPTIMAAVPMIMDKIASAVRAKVKSMGGNAQKLFDYAYASKLQAIKNGQDTPHWNRMLFDNLRTKLLGGRLRYMLSGGGPLSEDTQDFMNIAFCCPVGQGWGLTECMGCATTVWPNDRSSGRVGAPITSVQLKLIDWEEGGYYANPATAPADKKHFNPRGEVLIGGLQIADGYYKNPEETAKTFFEEDGVRYLRTGDIGEMCPDGALKLIDRKKDLVKLSGGEYVSYGKLEPMLRDSKYVDNGMIYANPLKSYCIAVVTRPPGSDNVPTETILEDITKLFKSKSCVKFEIPKKIFVASEEWTPTNDLCTAALKLKRQNIIKFYKEQIDKLYVD